MTEEVHLALPGPRDRIALATQFRGTWLLSSIRELKHRGLLEDYRRALPLEYHAPILDCVAGLWLPVEVAVAHYEACDALHLSPEEQSDIGRAVVRQVHGTVLGTFVKLARIAGLGPWKPLGAIDRMWSRVWVGGAVGVARLGPREARVEIVGWPCSRVPYCRMAMRGVCLGLTELFCERATCQEVASLCSETSLAYRLAWS